MSKRVLIVGDSPFIENLSSLCSGMRVSMYNITDLDQQENLNRMVRDATRCDIFLESLNESVESKRWLIEGVEPNLKPEAAILSHSLCASATETARWCINPERLIGYGFVPTLEPKGLIEFAPALQADFEFITAAREFWEKLTLTLVRVPDGPGLVRARMVFAMINEAIRTLDEHIANSEDIDRATEQVGYAPQGLLRWADVIGLDVIYSTLVAMQTFWGEERYHPSPLLRQKVMAKQLGIKSGRGFFVDPALL
jgi:3-hydroxybutyryl-CoA dehydrogenase